MTNPKADLLQGTLDMVILKVRSNHVCFDQVVAIRGGVTGVLAAGTEGDEGRPNGGP